MDFQQFSKEEFLKFEFCKLLPGFLKNNFFGPFLV